MADRSNKILSDVEVDLLEDVRMRCLYAGIIGMPYYLDGKLYIRVNKVFEGTTIFLDQHMVNGAMKVESTYDD